MLGQEQKPALNNSSRPQEYDYSRGPLTNTPVAYLELGTELLRGLVWAGCVSLWGREGGNSKEPRRALQQQEDVLSSGEKVSEEK